MLMLSCQMTCFSLEGVLSFAVIRSGKPYAATIPRSTFSPLLSSVFFCVVNTATVCPWHYDWVVTSSSGACL